MWRSSPILLVAIWALAACASAGGTRYTVTPETEVVVRAAKKAPPQANYRVPPEESLRTGAGGGGSGK